MSVSDLDRARRRREAARYLWVQSRNQTEAAAGGWERLTAPANRAEAAAAYREAMRRLMLPVHGGLGDVRFKVHEAAKVLGLTNADLSGPPRPGQ